MPQLQTSDKKVNTGAKYPRVRSAVRRSIEAVCTVYGLSPIDLMEHRRWLRIVRPRMLVCWLARQANVSFAEIGRRTGGLDHTTVRHGCCWIERRRDSDPGYYLLTEWLLAELLTPSRNAPEAPPAPAGPKRPPPTPKPKKAVRHDPWAAGNTFYCVNDNDWRASREFLEHQDKRFLQALAESGERP